MSFPRYSQYKDSGVDRLGEVPEHWTVKPLKVIATLNDDVLTDSTEPDYEIEYVDVGNVSLESGIESTQAYLFSDAPSRARRCVADGDVLISTVRTYLKAICHICKPPKNLVVSTGFAVVRPKVQFDKTFAVYALQSDYFIDEVISRSKGVSYPAINPTDLAQIILPVPPHRDQPPIARFLHSETAKIDALVAEQRRLIELLKEKRQAVISLAVFSGRRDCKGTVDSGSPWARCVPGGWSSVPLYTVATFTPGAAHEPFVDDAGSYVIANSRFVSTAGLSLKFCTENLTPARSQDILMVMSDLPNGRALARAFYVRTETNLAVNQRVCIIRATDADPRFLYFLLNRHPKLLSYNDGANQTHLPNDAFKKLRLFLPPMQEQKEIAAYLDRFSATMDGLTAEAEKAILLFRERRSALISAAVTGKIDVRGLAKESAA